MGISRSRPFRLDTCQVKFESGHVTNQAIFQADFVGSGELGFRPTLDRPVFGLISLSIKEMQLYRKFWIEYGSVRANSDFGSTFG